MAQVIQVGPAYTPFPTAEPRPAPPEDYQRIQATPRAFGAQVGEAEQRLGAGAEQAGHVFGQIAADDQVNHVLTGLDDLTTKFQALRGRDAPDQQAAYEQQMQQLMKEGRGNLSTPEQIVEFDRQARYLYSRAYRDIGLHADQQHQVWAMGVNQDGADSAINQAAKAALSGDQDAVKTFTDRAIDYRVKEAQMKYGMSLSPEIHDNVVRLSTAESAKAQVMALMPTNPSAAQKILDANSQYFEPLQYRALADMTQRSSQKADDDALVHSIVNGERVSGSRRGQPSGGPASDPRGLTPYIRSAAQKYGVDPDVAVRVAASEGLGTFTGDGGTSFGAFQLHVAPGAMGAAFQRDTGLDPSDPKNEHATIDYALSHAASGGWGPFRGAARAGIGDREGIGAAPAGAVTQQGVIQSPMQSPVPNFPTKEEWLSQIPEGLSDERYNDVFAKLTREYNRRVQLTSADRAQVLAQYKGGLQMLQDGRDFQIDETKIRSLFPKDIADQMVSDAQDARTIGEQVAAVHGMPLSDILNQQAANRAILSNSTGAGYERQQKRAAIFDRAAEAHIKALGQDPAAYVGATNPQIEVARQQMAAETPEQAKALTDAGKPSASESYANMMLAEQDRLQVPGDDRHVLSINGAQQVAARITGAPENAPATMKSLETQFGSAWPEVWKDLNLKSFGNLPAAYQMVGALDNESDGALLARGLASANKEGVNKPLEELLDRGATGLNAPSKAIKTRIEGSDAIRDYSASMLASGASAEQVRDIVTSISTLAQAKALYHNEQPAVAADEAVESAIGKWAFLPNGGARIPRDNSDAITQAAGQTVVGLSLAGLQPPALYAQKQAPGSATADDWLRVLKASPNWVTVGNSIRLMDGQGRFVRRAGGADNFIEVPFNVAGQPTPPLHAEPYNVPPPTP